MEGKVFHSQGMHSAQVREEHNTAGAGRVRGVKQNQGNRQSPDLLRPGKLGDQMRYLQKFMESDAKKSETHAK